MVFINNAIRLVIGTCSENKTFYREKMNLHEPIAFR